MAERDYDSLSDEELQKVISSGGEYDPFASTERSAQDVERAASEVAPSVASPAQQTGEIDYDSLSDADLQRIIDSGGEWMPQQAQPVKPRRPLLTSEERIARNNAAIERARTGVDDVVADIDPILEGMKGGVRAAKAFGGGVLGTATSAVRLAGTPVRALTGWDGIHRLADSIDRGYENWGADALAPEFDDWTSRIGEKVAGVAGSLAGLGAAGKAIRVAGGLTKAGRAANAAMETAARLRAAGKTAEAAQVMSSLGKGAKAAEAVMENALPAMFGNDAAVRTYDTAKQAAEQSGEEFDKARALGLASVNGAIHFFGFKAFENQSLNKMLRMPKAMEMQMPQWATRAANTVEGGAKSFSDLVGGVRTGMFKHIVAERGKGALKAGGIMGLQNFLSSIPTQMAEGADFADVDWARAATEGAHGVGEGALMEGLMGAAAALKTPGAARRFVADTYFRNGYRLPDGKKVPGLLHSPEGRMFIMKQNPEAQRRILDIVSHGGKVTKEELDAACLPDDMTTEELKRFERDWNRDLAEEETRGEEGEFLGDSEEMEGNENFAQRTGAENVGRQARDDAERERARARKAVADEELAAFNEWNGLYRRGEIDMSFDEWLAQRGGEQQPAQDRAEAPQEAAGERGAVETGEEMGGTAEAPEATETGATAVAAEEAPATPVEQPVAERTNRLRRPQPNFTGENRLRPEQEAQPQQERPDETRNGADEAPAQPEQGTAERTGEVEAPRPVEGAEARAEAPREGVVEPSETDEGRQKLTDAEPETATETAKTEPSAKPDAKSTPVNLYIDNEGVAKAYSELVDAHFDMKRAPSGSAGIASRNRYKEARAKLALLFKGASTDDLLETFNGTVGGRPPTARKGWLDFFGQDMSTFGTLIKKELESRRYKYNRKTGDMDAPETPATQTPTQARKTGNELRTQADANAAKAKRKAEAKAVRAIAMTNALKDMAMKASRVLGAEAGKSEGDLAKMLAGIVRRNVASTIEEFSEAIEAMPQGPLRRKAEALRDMVAYKRAANAQVAAEPPAKKGGNRLKRAKEEPKPAAEAKPEQEPTPKVEAEEAKPEPEAESEPAETEAKEKPSRTKVKNRVQKVKRIVDGIAKKEPLTSSLFRFGKSNPKGLELSELEVVKDLTADDWQQRLGLSKKRAAELQKAIGDAYAEQRAAAPHRNDKANATGQETNSVSASKALEGLARHPDSLYRLALAQMQVSAAAEAAKRQGDGKSADLWERKLADLNERISGLDEAAQGKIPEIQRNIQSKLTPSERKNRQSLTTSEGEEMQVADESAQESLEEWIEGMDGQASAEESARAERRSGDVRKSEADMTGDDLVEKGETGTGDAGVLRGGATQFAGFTASRDADGNIVLVREKDVRGEFGKYAKKQTSKTISETEFRAMAKALGVDADALLAKMEKGEYEARASKVSADSLPQGVPAKWTAAARKPLERVAHGLDNVVTVGGKKIKFEFLDERPTEAGANSFKNADGVTVGDYVDGEIRLYPGATVADVVHEFTHPLVDFARAEAEAGRGELLNKIKSIIETERKTWEKRVREDYEGKGEEEILEEIFTHAMGEKGEKLFGKSTTTLEGRRWYNRLWEAIKGVWRDFATKMGWNKADLSGLDKLTPEQAAQKILGEMAKGRNFGDVAKGGDGVRNAVSDSAQSISARLGKIKDWFYNGGENSDAFRNHPADWSTHDSTQPGFDKLSKQTRLAEAVGTLEAPQEFWKVFLPTGIEKVNIRTRNGKVVLLRDVSKYLMAGKFGYSTAVAKRIASGKSPEGGAIHILQQGHIAEGGYVSTKSVLTAQEINDNFLRCLDSPVKYDNQNRPYHEIDIGHGVKMRIGTRFLEVDGKMAEVPITMMAVGRNDWQSIGICKAVAKKMSEKKSVPISTESGAATSSQTPRNIPQPDAEVKGGEEKSQTRESRRVAAPGTAIMDEERTWGERQRERYFDSNAPYKDLQDEVGGVKEVIRADGYTDHKKSTDFVAAKSKYNGRVEYEMRDLQRRDDDVMRDLDKARLDTQKPKAGSEDKAGSEELLKDFNLFLAAEHAAERNYTHATENGVAYTPQYYHGMGKVKYGNAEVGLSEETADTIRKDLRAKYGAKFSHFEDAAQKAYKIAADELKRRLDGDLLSQADYDYYHDRVASGEWKHYVPLKTDRARLGIDDGDIPLGTKLHRSEYRKASGRGETVAELAPYTDLILQAEQGIKKALRNELANVEANFIEHATNTRGFKDADGNPLIAEIVPGKDVMTHSKNYEFVFGDGSSVMSEGSSRLAGNHPEIHLFKRGGQLMAIRYVKGKYGRGIDVAKSASGDNIETFGDGILSKIPKFTHFMSAMRTQYSPEFTVSNYLADSLEAAQALIGRYGVWDGAAAFAKTVAAEIRNAKDVWAYVRRGELRGDVKKAVEAGLLTKGGVASAGFEGKETSIRNRLEEFRRSAEGFTKLNAKDKVKWAWEHGKEFISIANEFMEYSTRIGLFSALYNKGVPINEAVKFAREATVDFNRKGTMMPIINGLYMFANASLQGAARAVQAGKESFQNLPDDGSGWGKHKIKGDLVALLAGIGVAKAVIDNLWGNDDDREKAGGRNASNLTEYDKKHNVGIPIGGGRQVPLLRFRGPYAAIPYLAQTAMNVVLGRTKPNEALAALPRELTDQITDLVGGNGMINDKGEFDWNLAGQSLAPSVLDPVIQLASGKDYKGEDRLRRSFNKTQPLSSNGKRNTAAMYKGMAQAVNWLTGGNSLRKGWLDFAPEDAQLVWEFIGGGLWRDVGNVWSTAQNITHAVKGGDTDRLFTDFPIIRRLWREYPESTGRYYDALERYEADKAEFKGTTSAARRRELRKGKPYLFAGKSLLDGQIERIKELAHLERGEIKSGQRWIEPKTPRSEEQKEKFRKQRLRLQAKVLATLSGRK